MLLWVPMLLESAKKKKTIDCEVTLNFLNASFVGYIPFFVHMHVTYTDVFVLL